MSKCHKFYPNCQWTATHSWPDLALEIVLLTEVSWSYSTRIVSVCFTPLVKPTIKKDFKCKSNLQIDINSPVMASLYDLLCYHSLEHFDLILDEFLTFIHSILSSLSSSPATSAVLPEATDCISMSFKILQGIPLKKFWNVQSQYSWTLATQRISIGIRRLNRGGRITPPAGVAESRHRKPPASAKDLTRAQKNICGEFSIA